MLNAGWLALVVDYSILQLSSSIRKATDVHLIFFASEIHALIYANILLYMCNREEWLCFR